MKFAVLALLGAVAANDEVELPRYTVDNGSYCTNLMYQSGYELGSAIRALPTDYNSQIAGVRVAEFLSGFGQLCSYNGRDLYCSAAAETALRNRYTAAHAALDKCGNYRCQVVKRELKEYFANMKRCLHQVGLDFAQLIKVTVPTAAGRAEIQHDIVEIEMDIRKIKQSPAAHAIMEDLQRWEVSAEAQQLKRDLQAFGNSPSGRNLAKEIQEALDILQNRTREVPNGIYIPNSAIPAIEKEFRDVETTANRIERTTQWDERLEASARRAFSQRDFQAAMQKLERLEKTADGQELKRDIAELKRDLKKNVVVSDLPN